MVPPSPKSNINLDSLKKRKENTNNISVLSFKDKLHICYLNGRKVKMKKNIKKPFT